MADSFITRRGGGGLIGIALIYCIFPTDADSVTCSNGTKTYTVPAKWLSSGGYCFAVNAEGTWTLTANKGAADNAVKTVNVQAGQQYMVELSFRLWLYKDGDQCTAVTGGWQLNSTTDDKYQTGRLTPTIRLIKTDGAVNGHHYAVTKNKVNLSGMSTLYYEISESYGQYVIIGVTQNIGTASGIDATNIGNYSPGVKSPGTGTISLDVSKVNSGYIVCSTYKGNACGLDVSRIYCTKG